MSDIYSHTLTHPRVDKDLSVPFGEHPATWSASKVVTCSRLIAAYKATITQLDKPLKRITDSDLWTSITHDNFKEMLAYIERNDALALSHYLTEFGRNYTWFGGITTGLDGYNHWDRSPNAVSFSYFDKLICLAEALGLLAVENPEQGRDGNWGQNIQLNARELADSIAAYLEIDIVPPVGVIPVAGIPIGAGFLHYRHINSLYMAYRIRNLTDPSDSIAEFGGGLGLVAYYLRLMSRRDVTLYDIPITNVLSGFFLIGALGHDAVSLEGERQLPDTIKVRANWNCVDAEDKRFKLTANQDSFPEINQAIFDQYIFHIHRTTTKYFLSINHEVEHHIQGASKHLNVSRLLASSRNMRRICRAPYWLRRGYVEELYSVLQ